MELNNCVFEKLVRFFLPCNITVCRANFIQGLKKTIPGAPENQTPVHLRPKQLYAQYAGPQY